MYDKGRKSVATGEEEKEKPTLTLRLEKIFTHPTTVNLLINLLRLTVAKLLW